jgi:chromosome segregation ATPase
MDSERLRDSIAAVSTQIEDLQSELEASARCVDRIHADVKTIDEREINYTRQIARMIALRDCASELGKSIRDQRAILRDLRRSVDQVRQSIRETKS